MGTPQLLLLSGIGPAEDLKNLDIPVVKDLSHVGRNLADVRPNLFLTLTFPDSSCCSTFQQVLYLSAQNLDRRLIICKNLFRDCVLFSNGSSMEVGL